MTCHASSIRGSHNKYEFLRGSHQPKREHLPNASPLADAKHVEVLCYCASQSRSTIPLLQLNGYVDCGSHPQELALVRNKKYDIKFHKSVSKIVAINRNLHEVSTFTYLSNLLQGNSV